MAITMKQARVGVDMTQRQMAEAMECSYGTYRKWERYPDEMPIKAARKFCEIVRLDLDDIIFAQKVN